MITVEKMCDEVVRIYGLENEITIWFYELAESLTQDQLLSAFICLAAGIPAYL